jgi:[acyl-carrier-protein] S-malonyltransferase
LLTLWSDHPQRLWDVVMSVLASGVRTIVHAGPAPRLIPKTFESICGRLRRQGDRPFARSLGALCGSTLDRWPALGGLAPERIRLLRAPYLTHVFLEDWLLDPSRAG